MKSRKYYIIEWRQKPSRRWHRGQRICAHIKDAIRHALHLRRGSESVMSRIVEITTKERIVLNTARKGGK